MLSLPVVQEIQRLLDEGELSQRKIANQLGVSRGTVNAIANGKRGIYGREPNSARGQTEEELVPQRCSGCGAMVYMPCILCRARAYASRNHRLHELEIPIQRYHADPRQVA